MTEKLNYETEKSDAEAEKYPAVCINAARMTKLTVARPRLMKLINH